MYKTGSDIFLGTDIDSAPEDEKSSSNTLNFSTHIKTNLSDYYEDNILYSYIFDKSIISRIANNFGDYIVCDKDSYNEESILLFLYINFFIISDVKSSERIPIILPFLNCPSYLYPFSVW